MTTSNDHDRFFDDVAPEDRPLPTTVPFGEFTDETGTTVNELVDAYHAELDQEDALLAAYRATHAAALPDGFFDDVAPEDQPLPTVVELGDEAV